jgi:hypothetical protein
MGDVLLGLADRVVLLEALEDTAYIRRKVREPVVLEDFDVASDEVDEIEKTAVFDRQRAIHIGFAGCEPWINKHSTFGRPVVQANGDAWWRTISELACLAAGINQGEITLIDYRVEKPR